jgi:uncharacterized protein (TIGR02996 family)
MTTLDDLLRAILADPADDGARLAYADWLEEEGQTERAEFVRVQCELARIDREEDAWHRPYVVNGERVTPEPWGTLRRREGELLESPCVPGGKTNREWWFSPFDEAGEEVPGDFGGSWRRLFEWEFLRGFIESVTCSCADWLAHGPAVVASQPVTAVRLADREPGKTANVPPSWGWFSRRTPDSELNEPSDIPPSLFDLLPNTRAHDNWQWARRFFPTRDAAHASLSAACVRWARAAAGLPPLAG